MRVSKTLAGLVSVLSLAIVATPPPAAAQDPAPPKVTIGVKPEATKPLGHEAKVGELVRLAGDKPSVRWEVTPASEFADLVTDGKGGAAFTASKVGTYFVVCYDNGPAAWVRIDVCGPNPEPLPPTPMPPVPPGPVPPGPPVPPTPPKPVGQVKKFVVVEDTLKAGQFRADVMASAELATFYRANALKHRLLDVRAADGADAEAAAFFAAATGKELPWLWTFDAAGEQIASMKAPTTPDGFVAALAERPAAVAPHKRAMGNRPPPANKVKFAWTEFGSEPKVPLIARANWKPVNLAQFLPEVKDQDGVGACNAFATVTAVEACRAQVGLPYVRLSPGYLYGNINGQRDDGSLLEDSLSWMLSKGTCLASTVPELAWKRSQWPARAAKEAEDYLVLEAYLCPNFDAAASAIQQGFFVIEGLMWADGDNPDRDSWLPSRASGNTGGHALCGCGLEKRNGEWGIVTRNSWSEGWGKAGNCVIPESRFNGVIGGMWAVRSVKQSASDFPVTPKLSSLKVNPARVRDAEFVFALAP